MVYYLNIKNFFLIINYYLLIQLVFIYHQIINYKNIKKVKMKFINKYNLMKKN